MRWLLVMWIGRFTFSELVRYKEEAFQTSRSASVCLLCSLPEHQLHYANDMPSKELGPTDLEASTGPCCRRLLFPSTFPRYRLFPMPIVTGIVKDGCPVIGFVGPTGL